MLKLIKSFFKKTKQPAPMETAPYKVPEPPTKTPIPLVADVQLPLVQLEQVAAPVSEVAPAKKPRKPRAPKAETPVAKPAAKKVTPAKKPRAPRAPKVK